MNSNFRDIIRELSDRLLDHVAEHILAQLDVESLCSAELVSKEWRHIVLRTRTWLLLLQHQQMTQPSIWKAMWHRMGMGDASDAFSAKKKCLAVKHALQVMDSNWRSGNYRTSETHISFQLAPPQPLCATTHSFEMNQRYVFPSEGPLNHWNIVGFIDRSATKDSKVLHTLDMLYRCDADGEVAVIGYVDGSLSVVEIATGRQVNELMDLTDSTMACVRFRCGRLAALTFVDDGLGTDEKRLTLWKVDELDKMTIEAQLPLSVSRARLELDGDVAVVFSERGVHVAYGAGPKRLHRLNFEAGAKILEAQYRTGLLMTLEEVDRSRQLRIVDISTGVCLRLLERIRPDVTSFRFNSKYVVALVHDHALHVVDLVAALANPNADWTELTLATIAMESMKPVAAFQVDDFEVWVYGSQLMKFDLSGLSAVDRDETSPQPV